MIAICVLCLSAQDPKQAVPAKTAPQQSSPAPQLSLPQIQLDDNATLHHLNQVISWYRHSTTGMQSVGLPSDAIYQDNTQSFGAQAVRLAFQSAKAESLLIAAQQKATGTNQESAESTQQQNLSAMQAKTSSQIEQLQSQIENLNTQLTHAPTAKRNTLIAQRDAFQGQLELQKALLDALQKMSAFVENNDEIAGGLEGSINQLAKSIPEVLVSSEKSQRNAAAPAAAKPTISNSGGLISEAVTLYDYMSAAHQLEGLVRETAYAREVADQLRTPLRDALRATIQQSQTLSVQPGATDPRQIQAERQEFQALTQRCFRSARKSSYLTTVKRTSMNGVTRSSANRSMCCARCWCE